MNRIIYQSDYANISDARLAASLINGIVLENGVGRVSLGRNAEISTNTEGTHDGAAMLASTGTASQADGALLLLYGGNHATWAGHAFLSARTGNPAGCIFMDSYTHVRQRLTIGWRWGQTPTSDNLYTDVVDLGALTVYGPYGTLSVDKPQVPGLTPQTNANLAVYMQRGASATPGISRLAENTVSWREVWGDDLNKGRFQQVFDFSSGTMQFHVNDGESFRIWSNRNLSFGKTAQDLSISGMEYRYADKRLYLTNSGAACLQLDRRGSDGPSTLFCRDGVTVGSISHYTSSTNYNTTSDYRVKTALMNFDALEILQRLPVYDLMMILSGERVHAALAHEWQETLPYAVTGEKDEQDANGNPVLQMVDYSKAVPVVVGAVQQLKQRIEQLERLTQ